MKYHPVIKAAAKAARIPCAELVTSRKKEPTAWRQVAIYAMRDSGMTYAEIAAATKRDTSTAHSTCDKLNKLASQKWFKDMLAKLHSGADAAKRRQAEQDVLDDLCARAPLRLYMNAFSMADD